MQKVCCSVIALRSPALLLYTQVPYPSLGNPTIQISFSPKIRHPTPSGRHSSREIIWSPSYYQWPKATSHVGPLRRLSLSKWTFTGSSRAKVWETAACDNSSSASERKGGLLLRTWSKQRICLPVALDSVAWASLDTLSRSRCSGDIHVALGVTGHKKRQSNDNHILDHSFLSK